MLCGWIGALLVTIVIVAVVEMISKTQLPYGWLGNIVVGFIGGGIWPLGVGRRGGGGRGGACFFNLFLGALVFFRPPGGGGRAGSARRATTNSTT